MKTFRSVSWAMGCYRQSPDEGDSVLPTAFRLLIVLMMEAVSTSETSVNFYEATQRSMP
jgi:hypothetical protein